MSSVSQEGRVRGARAEPLARRPEEIMDYVSAHADLMRRWVPYHTEPTLGTHWLCLCCGADLGESNPRQFCRKTFCPSEEAS